MDDTRQAALKQHSDSDALVLAIDDEPLALEIAEMALQRRGFRTTSARGGVRGWEKVQEIKPDLVLLDIRMPDLDGFTLFHRIRHHDELKHTPVIFVTASSDIETKLTGLELGAVDYLTKPYNPNELVARVRNTLRLQRLEQDARERHGEEVRRKTYETLMITISHYINNAIASIEMGAQVTPEEDLEAVRKLKTVIQRQCKVIGATVRAIEEMKERIEQQTVSYATGQLEMLDIEDLINEFMAQVDGAPAPPEDRGE